MHKGEIFDIRQVSGIRPNSDLQIRKLVTERVAPRPGVADMFVEINDEQRRGWNGAQQSLRGDVQVRSDQRTEPVARKQNNRSRLTRWLEGRLIITPHAAWLTPESETDTRRKSAETMRAALLTNRPQNVITPEVY